jgi:hypothetical protein
MAYSKTKFRSNGIKHFLVSGYFEWEKHQTNTFYFNRDNELKENIV